MGWIGAAGTGGENAVRERIDRMLVHMSHMTFATKENAVRERIDPTRGRGRNAVRVDNGR